MKYYFDINVQKQLIDEFLLSIPTLIRNNQIISSLSNQVERLWDDSQTPFTLAIVGQMKIGKSSLINGLIGKELSIVGVNETTATINYFKFGNQGQDEYFTVHWIDKASEKFPLNKLSKWAGNSDIAGSTKYIEFYDSSEFLKRIHLVDTPGTRTTLGKHVEIINSFLSAKRDQETYQHGGKADAIIYVSGPIANISAEAVLDEFMNTTRLPGSSPYNSIAVLHKWEVLDSEDPYLDALEKAETMKSQFRQYVSTVIPVSGPLALAAKTRHSEFWDKIIKFIQNHDQDIVKSYIDRGERRFIKKYPNGGILFRSSALPWPSFKYLMKNAIKMKFVKGIDLKASIIEISGIDRLNSIIKDIFVKRSNLIKSFSTLKKAIEPCHKAQLRLENDIIKNEKTINEIEESLSYLNSAYNNDNENIQKTCTFLSKMIEKLSNANSFNKKDKVELSKKASTVEEIYKRISGDINALNILDRNINRFSKNEVNEILSILGCNGFTVSDRIDYLSNTKGRTIEKIVNRINYWEEKQFGLSTDLTSVSKQIILRLEEIAEAIESGV